MEVFEGVGDRIAAILRRHPSIGNASALGREAGVSRQTLHRAMNEDTLTRETARAIAKALGISLDDLLNEGRTVPFSLVPFQNGNAPTHSFTRGIRERVMEMELELFRMGASDDEVSGFAVSLRGNPVLVAAFSGGAPEGMTDEDVQQLFEAAASGYKRIVKRLIDHRQRAKRTR